MVLGGTAWPAQDADHPEKTRREQAGFEDGRSDRIRTYDPLVPNQMRYQTALRSEASIVAADVHSQC